VARRDGLDPLVLTRPTSLPKSTTAFLDAHPEAEVIVLGGPQAIAPAVAQEAEADRRVGGNGNPR
jgi:hypothetical protein